MSGLGIVQARMASSRLPGKVMRPVNGRPALAYVVERSIQASRLDRIVLATSVNCENDVIAEWGASQGYEIFRGDEDDVLSRFVALVRRYAPDTVARINADNFAIDPDVIDHALAVLQEEALDVVTPFIDNTYPFGTGAEVATAECVLRLASDTADGPAEMREHIFFGAYRNPDAYRWGGLVARPELTAPDIDISVDTPEQFDRILKLFHRFEGRELAFRTEDVIAAWPGIVA